MLFGVLLIPTIWHFNFITETKKIVHTLILSHRCKSRGSYKGAQQQKSKLIPNTSILSIIILYICYIICLYRFQYTYLIYF